jgi:hypothetical protein
MDRPAPVEADAMLARTGLDPMDPVLEGLSAGRRPSGADRPGLLRGRRRCRRPHQGRIDPTLFTIAMPMPMPVPVPAPGSDR